MSGDPQPSVPLCDLGIQYQGLRDELLAAAARVLDSGQVILGPEVAALEEEVAAWCGAAHAVACSSGSDALSLALAALEIGPGDEVILPPFTFFATAGAVLRCGATPVFADIEPATFNIDPQKVEAAVSPRTRAVIPVHLFGQCADMEPLWRLAERHGLALIEDAAQAFGAEYQGRRAGTLGAIGCFSFYPSKNLAAYGDAGMITTDDADLARRVRALRVHGMEPKYYHKYAGWNARMDAVQAAMLRVKLPHVGGWLEGRRAAAGRYDALIEAEELTGFLRRPAALPGRRHVYNQYVVRVPAAHRDALAEHLRREGIGCEIYYPLPLHAQECLRHLGHAPGDFPVSEAAARTVLALPMFPEITEDQQLRVLGACADFARSRAGLAA
ncbi:MAG TPA: DegT/DnrJ/EryC1/StrS family aminotransferase [Gemmataceae bacterium]